MRFKDYKIGTKLYLGFSLTIVIIVLFGVITFNGFSEIMRQIKTANLMSGIVITVTSTEQTNMEQQINNTIQQLNNVTQQTAISSEELAINTEEMSSQAYKLKDLILFSKIDNLSHSSQFNKKRQVDKKQLIKSKWPQMQPGNEHLNFEKIKNMKDFNHIIALGVKIPHT